MEIIIKPELRPCIINGEKKGLFHCWEQHAEPIVAGLSIGSHPGGQLSCVLGIVELEDGHVIKAHPSSIQFIDNKTTEYDFSEIALKGAENE